jgi:hypothetical protein
LLAQAEGFDPPGLGSEGVSAVWPEPDLVYLATGSDGFRAYVVNPSAPSLQLHRDCRTSGFATNLYSTALMARCFKHHREGDRRRLVVGSTPGLLVGSPTVNLFDLGYPEGVPDRHHPDRPIWVAHEATLACSKWKAVRNLDVHPAGLVAAATSAGLAVFHLEWVAALNQMNDGVAWNRIRVPAEAYAPWWHASWTADMADVSFADHRTLYVVKAPEGVWRLTFEFDPTNRTHRAMSTAYYPGVSCGMDYRRPLHGWANPDIPTLHHPYGVVADGDTAWVTGWSGKVQRLAWQPDSGLRILRLQRHPRRIELEFYAPFGPRMYRVEAAPELTPNAWRPLPGTLIRQVTDTVYVAELAADTLATGFFRVAVSP